MMPVPVPPVVEAEAAMLSLLSFATVCGEIGY